jgi:hypothetical protein
MRCRPEYHITLDGRDLTTKIAPDLISLDELRQSSLKKHAARGQLHRPRAVCFVPCQTIQPRNVAR